jgi:hypothetical protein
LDDAARRLLEKLAMGDAWLDDCGRPSDVRRTSRAPLIMSVTRRGLKMPDKYESTTVKAGILEGATYPARTLTNAATGAEMQDPRAGMHVATIAAALEYGNGQNHPRPFMQQTVAAEKAAWTESVVTLMRNGSDPTTALRTVGQIMKEDIQRTINDWPADNSESWAAFKGFNKGLIQTSHLLNSVEAAIEEKGE